MVEQRGKRREKTSKKEKKEKGQNKGWTSVGTPLKWFKMKLRDEAVEDWIRGEG